MVATDIDSARAEYYSWPKDGTNVWVQLHIWAMKFTSLQPIADIVNQLLDISDDVFWEYVNRRDLLTTLRTIWPHLSTKQRRAIELRLIHGHPGLSRDFIEADFVKYTGYLMHYKCNFSKSAQLHYDKMRKRRPELSEKYIRNLDQSDEPKIMGGFIQTIADSDCLNGVPIHNVLDECTKQSKTDFYSLKEYKPFIGLVRNRPIRAFHALTYHACLGSIDNRRWEDFFYNIRIEDSPISARNLYLFYIIISRILRFDDALLKPIIRPLSYWFARISIDLSRKYPKPYELMINKLIRVIIEHPEIAKYDGYSSISDSTVSSPLGRVIEAWLGDARYDKNKRGLPKAKTEVISTLLNSDGIIRQYSLSRLSRDLFWLYQKAKIWTTHYILPVFNNENLREIAIVMDGMHGYGSYPPSDLFLVIKKSLIDVIRKKTSDKSLDKFWNLLIYGWFIKERISGEYLVTNNEFHDLIMDVDDDSRHTLLWTLGIQFCDCDELKPIQYARLKIFFRDIWPKQKTINTPNTTSQIMNLMFSNVDTFKAIYEETKYCFSELNHSVLFPKVDKKVLDRYHCEVFALLNRQLPYDKARWPYEAKELIITLGDYCRVAKTAEYQMFIKRFSL